MDIDRVKLIDFGNTNAKIYHEKKITTMKVDEFDFSQKDFYYINVNQSIKHRLKGINLENKFSINSNYKGLGIDRKVLCYYISDGVIVDAGSAITVDVMHRSLHKGGFIYPGINSLYKAFEDISPILKIKKENQNKSFCLPKSTVNAVEFGIFYPIINTIKEVSKDYKIYFCGGDGKELSNYFENAIFYEDLIFKAMKKIIKENLC